MRYPPYTKHTLQRAITGQTNAMKYLPFTGHASSPARRASGRACSRSACRARRKVCKRAIEVSVNVAGAEDPQRAVELLKRTVASRPNLAKEPVSQVHVVSFSAGAVTFQLRSWTNRHQDWARVRIDLSIAINDTLARENIAIA